MTTPFLLDIGFSKIQIANIVKVIGLAATLIGLFIGGMLVAKYNIVSVLFIGGFLQMFSNLFFAVNKHKLNCQNLLSLPFKKGISTPTRRALVWTLCQTHIFTHSAHTGIYIYNIINNLSPHPHNRHSF